MELKRRHLVLKKESFAEESDKGGSAKRALQNKVPKLRVLELRVSKVRVSKVRV